MKFKVTVAGRLDTHGYWYNYMACLLTNLYMLGLLGVVHLAMGEGGGGGGGVKLSY